jgi:large subunit ribosomal protein L18
MASSKDLRRNKIKLSIRRKISGSATKPRLTVFRSNTSIYAQIIDDVTGRTLASASVSDLGETKTGTKVEQSKAVGQKLAEKAIQGGIVSVVFDRNGYLYHGRIKALAEGAREGGLNF